MSDALRIQVLTLPVGDLAPVDKFYRWALAMKPAGEAGDGVRALGWGHEDRLDLVDASAVEGVEEAVTLRLPAHTIEGLSDWLGERGLAPVALSVPVEDVAAASEMWPDADVAALEEDEEANRLIVSLRGPGEPRFDLFASIPKETLLTRDRMGPFSWKTKGWKGLEVPGLLGVEIGTPDPAATADFLVQIGLEAPTEEGAPYLAGDHQVRITERDRAGIYGLAVVVGESRVKDIARTLESLDGEYRHEKNRILAADPAGRILLVHGIHGR